MKRIGFKPVATMLTGFLALASGGKAIAQIDVAGLHPGYASHNLWNDAMGPEGIGDFDFLADGRLAVCIWGGVQRKAGKILILGDLERNQASAVTTSMVASGLNEPLGLKVIGDDIYFMLKNELSKLTRNPDASYVRSTIYSGFNHNPLNDHQFSTNLVHKDGAFYFLATSSYAIMRESPERGALIRIDPVKKSHEIFANGFREPNGLILGPDDEFFVTDNQGEFIVTNKLINARKGRFYGCHGTDAPVAAGRPETPPTLYLPYGETSFSTSQPVFLKQGPFAGQMLVGDVHYGGLNRIYLEKVRAPSGALEFQACLFRFSSPGSIPFGVNRLKEDSRGSLYAGGVGWGPASHNWNYKGVSRGLLKLVPNGKKPFEMLAVRARANGFEIEFTQPAGPNAAQVSGYALRKWWHLPTAGYGGPKIGNEEVAIQSVTLSADGRKAQINLSGAVATPNLFFFKLDGVVSRTGEALWSNEAWYTRLYPGQAEVPTSLSREKPFLGREISRDGSGRCRISLADGRVRVFLSIGRGAEQVTHTLLPGRMGK